MVEPTRVIGRSVGAVGWLVALNGRHAGRDSRLGRSTRIGRDSLRNDIILDDPAVSAEHARIRMERGHFVLYDLANTNGTFVNRQRTQKQTLMDGDEIRIGRSVFVFKEVRR